MLEQFTNLPDLLPVVLTISVLSVVQSLFGVGLLVFGTPTLLLLGYSFETSLFLLLPSSIAISAVQVFQERANIEIKKEFFYYALPFAVIGLTVVLSGVHGFNSKLIVAAMLVVTVALKSIPRVNAALGKVFRKNLTPVFAALGLIHGLTNMGGGLLTILMSNVFDTKIKIRTNIAFCYLVFGIVQFLVLLFRRADIQTAGLILPVISLSVFFSVGTRVYRIASEKSYLRLISLFMLLSYGTVLIITEIV